MSYSSRAYTTFMETVRVRGLRITPTAKDGDRGYILKYAFPQAQLSDAYHLEPEEENDSLAFAGIEGIGDILKDIVEECGMEVTILPAQYSRREAPVDYPQSEGPSDLAKQIGKICKP